MALANLSSLLWRQRELLELLVFKLEEEQMMLASGRSKWLAHATREVEAVLDQIRRTEVLRAAEADAAARDLGLPPNPSLADLAAAATEPWASLLRDHRQAFLTLTAEITTLAQANKDLLTAGQRAVRESLLSVTGSVETYGPTGVSRATAPARRLIDEAI
jgi:flagellar biosynthesis/type III secretory pathway chaperone